VSWTSRIISFYEYKLDGYIYDVTRKRIDKIDGIYQNGDTFEYALEFTSHGSTHYLPIDQLRQLYPFVGTNLEAIKVLYGQV